MPETQNIVIICPICGHNKFYNDTPKINIFSQKKPKYQKMTCENCDLVLTFRQPKKYKNRFKFKNQD